MPFCRVLIPACLALACLVSSVRAEDVQQYHDRLLAVAETQEQNATARMELGRLLLDYDILQDALVRFDEAEALEPMRPGPAAGRCMVLDRLGLARLADEACANAVQRRAVDAEDLAWRARARMRNENWEAADEDLTRALDDDPKLRWAWVALGNVEASQGRWFEAEEAFLRALAINAGDAYVHALVGGVRLAEGDLAGALRSLNTSVRLDPDAAWVRLERSRLLGRLGIFWQAEQEWDAAHRLDPTISD